MLEYALRWVLRQVLRCMLGNVLKMLEAILENTSRLPKKPYLTPSRFLKQAHLILPEITVQVVHLEQVFAHLRLAPPVLMHPLIIFP